MKKTEVALQNIVDLGDGNYSLNLWFQIGSIGNFDELRVNDIITDKDNSTHIVVDFDGSPNRFTESGGVVVVTPALFAPASSTGYDSFCESEVVPDMSPDIIWECEIATSEQYGAAYNYEVTVRDVVVSDTTSGQYIADIGDALIDGNGNAYEVIENWDGLNFPESPIKVKDIFERGGNDGDLYPLVNAQCFICRPKPDGSLLIPSLLERLDSQLVRDKIVNLNAYYAWKYRGIQVKDVKENITNIIAGDGINVTLLENEDGWQGGNALLIEAIGGGGSVTPAVYCSEATPKTAIVPYEGEFVAMNCMEASEVLFYDRYVVNIGVEESIGFNSEFISVCENGKIFPHSIVSEDGTRISIESLNDRKIVIKRELSGPVSFTTRVWVTMVGVRKGMGDKFKRMSKEQFETNREFYNKAHGK